MFQSTKDHHQGKGKLKHVGIFSVTI